MERIEFGHGIGDWRTGCEDDTAFVCELVEVLDLGEHVVCLRVCAVWDTVYLREESQVLVVMGFIDIEAVKAKGLKANRIILLGRLLGEVLDGGKNLLLGTLGLLNGKAFPAESRIRETI